MFTDKEVKGCGTFICICIIFVLGALSGWKASDEGWRKDTVDRGLAEYNRQTGLWQWKSSETAE